MSKLDIFIINKRITHYKTLKVKMLKVKKSQRHTPINIINSHINRLKRWKKELIIH